MSTPVAVIAGTSDIGKRLAIAIARAGG